MINRYDPFREALSLRRAMDQLFEQSFVNPSMMSGSPTVIAPMDVCETDNGYEVDVALPGVRPEDIELTVDQNTLTIRGRFSHQNDHQNQPEGQTQGQQQTQPAQAQGQQQTQPAQAQGQPSQQQSQQGGGQQAQQGKTERHRKGHNWLSREIVAGAFERSITFPRPIDTNNIQTKFENGILTIRLPISEASRPKRISLKGDTVAQSSQSSQQQQVPVGAGQKQGS